MQPIDQLDQQHPHVLGHGHHHLADGGGLRLLHRGVVDPVQLGDAVDQGGDLRAELDHDLLQGDLGVLHRVVEEGGGDGGGVESVVGQVPGDGEGMGDVGMAGLAHLPGVGPAGELEGALENVHLALRMMGDERLHHVVEGGGGGIDVSRIRGGHGREPRAGVSSRSGTPVR